MKTLRPLFLCLMLIVIAVPLAIGAQDTPIDVHPATPATEELIEYPDGSLNLTPGSINLPLAQTPTEELIEYPVTSVATDPCAWDGEDLVVPLCPSWTPTSTPTPAATQKAPQEAVDIVNGLWIQESSDFSSSGTCQADYGDNDGPPNYGSEDEIPRVPACMSADNQWLSVNNNGPFPQVMDGVYSTQEMQRELLMTGGETSGSVNVTNRREYRVISPTVIEFSYTIQEEGGCTRTSTIRYKLVEPNDMVCNGGFSTPEMTSTAVSTPVSTPQPGETLQPPPTPEPPVKPGRYIIELPTDDAACTDETLPPGDAVDVSYDDNDNMFINFGGGSYTLFWDGDDYYQYQNTNRFQVSVITYEGGASFAWSNRANPGDPICYVGSDLIEEGAPTATPMPVEPTNEAYTDAGAIAGSSFNTTWETPDYLCPDGKTDILPNLDGVVLTAQADGTFLLTLSDSEFVLTNVEGIHGYSEYHDDGSLLSITMNGFYEGQGMGSYTVINAEGEMCMAQLTFTPAG